METQEQDIVSLVERLGYYLDEPVIVGNLPEARSGVTSLKIAYYVCRDLYKGKWPVLYSQGEDRPFLVVGLVNAEELLKDYGDSYARFMIVDRNGFNESWGVGSIYSTRYDYAVRDEDVSLFDDARFAPHDDMLMRNCVIFQGEHSNITRVCVKEGDNADKYNVKTDTFNNPLIYAALCKMFGRRFQEPLDPDEG